MLYVLDQLSWVAMVAKALERSCLRKIRKEEVNLAIGRISFTVGCGVSSVLIIEGLTTEGAQLFFKSLLLSNSHPWERSTSHLITELEDITYARYPRP